MKLIRFITKNDESEVFINFEKISYVRKMYGNGTVLICVDGEEFCVSAEDYDKALQEYKKDKDSFFEPLIRLGRSLITSMDRFNANIPHSIRLHY